MSGHHGFVPALGLRVLTPLYDRLISFTLQEIALKRRLIEQARLAPKMRVVDLGCGTGTLALLLAREGPDLNVTGVDVDPDVLAIARRKAADAGVAIEWILGRTEEAPIAPGSVDRVFSTLMLHHLAADEKHRALSDARRWLAPGGELHVADFGPPQDPLMWTTSWIVRLADGAGRVRDQLEGHLPEQICAAGFASVQRTHRARTVFGTLDFLRAV